jgi:hypothetical protein
MTMGAVLNVPTSKTVELFAAMAEKKKHSKKERRSKCCMRDGENEQLKQKEE